MRLLGFCFPSSLCIFIHSDDRPTPCVFISSDTTASALAIFVMAMITHPRVMKKAQEELDRVVGPGRLPAFSDFDDLVYVRALCQEVSRWRPVSSGGFRHSLTEDVHYKGFVLPKGSAVVGNHW